MCLIVVCEFAGFIIWQVGLLLIAWVGYGRALQHLFGLKLLWCAHSPPYTLRICRVLALSCQLWFLKFTLLVSCMCWCVSCHAGVNHIALTAYHSCVLIIQFHVVSNESCCHINQHSRQGPTSRQPVPDLTKHQLESPQCVHDVMEVVLQF